MVSSHTNRPLRLDLPCLEHLITCQYWLAGWT